MRWVIGSSWPTPFQQEWELYNLRTDRTETVNLFNQREDKAQELKTLWQYGPPVLMWLPKPGGKI